MPLSVIGAGFGRTGTLSLKGALEQLGFGPCYHMLEAVAHPPHIEFWERAVAGDAVDWEEVFADYNATVDWPACIFYKELMARYPQAKVLLSVRDPERWYKSAQDTIFSVMDAQEPPGESGRALRMARRVVQQRSFRGRTDDPHAAMAVFGHHNAEVKRSVPRDKLLVYDVSQGWAPLCAFLGVPVPDTPFPHVNTTDDFRQMMAAGMQKKAMAETSVPQAAK